LLENQFKILQTLARHIRFSESMMFEMLLVVILCR